MAKILIASSFVMFGLVFDIISGVVLCLSICILLLLILFGVCGGSFVSDTFIESSSPSS